MKKKVLFFVALSLTICLLTMFNYNDAQATLISSSLDLSGDLTYSLNNSNYVTETNSQFSGTNSSYLAFTRTGDYTGRTFNSMIGLNSVSNDHLLTIDYDISALNTSVYTGDTYGLGLGYNIGAYAYLTFFSATDEQVTFTKAYTGYFADQSWLYDLRNGNSYSPWGDDFEEITFNHSGGTTYEYRFQVAYVLGGGTQVWDSYYTLDIQTISSSNNNSVPEPATMLLLGLGLVGLAGVRRKFKK